LGPTWRCGRPARGMVVSASVRCAAAMGASAADADPVRRRRAQVERAARVASRTGYALIAVAVVVFFIALVTGFDAVLAAIVTATLIAGCVLLAPAIILGYAVKAAERDDAERGR
jgi:hypothetical protein